MKALILSGGSGTRLRPLTHTGAKQLIPVANKPILFYCIEAIRAAGISDFGIVVGDTRRDVMEAVGDGGRWGIRVTYIEQDAPRGLAHAVLIARDFLADDPFIMFLGDNLVREGVAGFVQRFAQARAAAAAKGREEPAALILLSEVEEPQRFGVAVLEGGRVVRLIEKPDVPPSNLALVGVYLFNRHIHEAVRSIAPSWRGELEITDAIQWLIDRGYTVEPHMVTGWWKDTGKPEDVLEANRLVLEGIERRVEGEVDAGSRVEGRVVVEAGARIVASHVRGPASISAGALIENAYIGPFTSIGPGVTVRSSEVENSVLMEGALIEGVPGRLDESLVGRRAVLRRGDGRPRVVRAVLGELSRVELA